MNTETQNYESERKILDSGNRRKFESGAVRDMAKGKGRCDLLPLDIIVDYFDNCQSDDNIVLTIETILTDIHLYLMSGNSYHIYHAIGKFMDEAKYDSTISCILELSKHYEAGCEKYEERNWEKGILCHSFIDSGIRHFLKWVDKWDDEPHDRAFLWNMFGLLWTVKHRPECNDLPYTTTHLTEEEKNYVKHDVESTKEAYHRIMEVKNNDT